MLIDSLEDETRRRDTALKVIRLIIREEGRSKLYDLTGLAGGFPLQKEDLDLLETYAGPAYFEDVIQKQGVNHLGGEEVIALNRTSSGILATILALVRPGDQIVHYLPHRPAHPSIIRSAKLVGASYEEYEEIKDFNINQNTRLVIITGATMDHVIIPEKEFKQVIKLSHAHNIPILVDDASGARLRTIIYQQPKALDLGADLVITSTDKLMDGPRGGLMSGKPFLIQKIKTIAHQYGLEAQAPLIAGMVRALESFNPEKILKALEKKDELYELLKPEFKNLEKTPTGIILSAEALYEQVKEDGFEPSLNSKEIASLFAMLLLRKQHIITIPAVGMPGASPSIRLDLASKDAQRIELDYLADALSETYSILISILSNPDKCAQNLYS